jgi:histidine triad (HIT) family protein
LTPPCSICAFLAGDPEYAHEKIFDDGEHIAFLDKYPTMYGRVLVAPQGNAHLHWHVAPLAAALAARLRHAIM